MLHVVSQIVAAHPGVEVAVRAVTAGEGLVLEGLSGSFRAAVLARLHEAAGRPLAVVLPQGIDREALLLDLRAFHPAADGH